MANKPLFSNETRRATLAELARQNAVDREKDLRFSCHCGVSHKSRSNALRSAMYRERSIVRAAVLIEMSLSEAP